MSRKEDFYFLSSNGTTKIHGVRYIPDGKIKAVLQISHGMVEYIERYEEFALFLNSKGILVTGNDHLGHGASVSSKEDWGYFAEYDGNNALLYDLYQMTQITKEKYPGIPYFLLGHSMGSFYARQYLCQFGNELTGAIIMGTGHQPYLLVLAGKITARLVAAFKGWHYRCEFIDRMAFGNFNQKFYPARTNKDWLTKDSEKVDEYLKTECCNFSFTVNAYYNMFLGISRLYHRKLLRNMPKELPVLFVSGEDDPVGDFSKGVRRAVKSFRKVGMKQVRVKLYQKDRHELLNETDRQRVFKDLYRWMHHYI